MRILHSLKRAFDSNCLHDIKLEFAGLEPCFQKSTFLNTHTYVLRPHFLYIFKTQKLQPFQKSRENITFPKLDTKIQFFKKKLTVKLDTICQRYVAQKRQKGEADSVEVYRSVLSNCYPLCGKL